MNPTSTGEIAVVGTEVLRKGAYGLRICKSAQFSRNHLDWNKTQRGYKVHCIENQDETGYDWVRSFTDPGVLKIWQLRMFRQIFGPPLHAYISLSLHYELHYVLIL